MIRFLTLGTTELEADDDVSAVADLVSQPKRLALLTFLTIDRPGARHFRDTLLALLWPDLDTDRARHALRQTLYHLRQTLGSEVVLGEDQSGVGVDGTAVWCDAVAFEEEIDRGRPAHALELYGGEFMPGFHSESGPAYDLWLDTVRQRLERKAVEAAWSLADRAESRGDTREACAWARRVVRLQPYHERAGRRLARLLGATGQRVEALRTLDRLVSRLEGEGLVPEPETWALADRVRQGDLEDLAGRYRGLDAPARSERTIADCTLAVLPFSPLSASGVEIVFAEGLTELLITELARCGCASVLSRTSVLPYREGERSLPAVADELGVDYVVEGSVAIDTGRLRVTAQLLAAVPERHLWAACFERAFGDLMELQTELAAAIADVTTTVLGEQLGQAAAPVAPAGTGG